MGIGNKNKGRSIGTDGRSAVSGTREINNMSLVLLVSELVGGYQEKRSEYGRKRIVRLELK